MYVHSSHFQLSLISAAKVGAYQSVAVSIAEFVGSSVCGSGPCESLPYLPCQIGSFLFVSSIEIGQEHAPFVVLVYIFLI